METKKQNKNPGVVKHHFYTCFGVYRPPCRTNHKTLETAERCLDRDRQLCKRFNGVSDRYIAMWDGGKFENVTLPKKVVK